MTRTIIILALTLRVFIAVTTQTFFQPDEYFQSLEPAHNSVFGYGHITWEWLTANPIRSVLYPALNVPIYWLLKITGLHAIPGLGPYLVIQGPRVLHGLLAGITDISVHSLARRTLGERYANAAFFVSLTSFFHALSLSRSLSNSLETSLTTLAFAYYPWDASARLSPQLIYHRPNIRAVLMFAALACAIRSTSAVIWVYLFANLVWSLRKSPRLLVWVILDALIIGATALLFLFAIDSLYFGKAVFTPLSFVATNLSGVSLFYGTSPWHYYLTQGLPILCVTTLPFALHGAVTAWKGQATAPKTMVGLIAWSIFVYSFAGHKEWRFIHPVLPLLHLLAAKSLVDLSSPTKKKLVKSHPTKTTSWSSTLQVQPRFVNLILLQLPASMFVAWVYCRAPIGVMGYIRSLPSNELRGGVGFLMPCHSTPGHAYLHRPELVEGRLWAIGCEPPINVNPGTYRDQTTVFFAAPHTYINDRFPATVNPRFPVSPFPASSPGNSALQGWKHEWPRHLVFFGALLEQDGVSELLRGKGYSEVWKAGWSWEGDGDERKGSVRVWKWAGQPH